MLETFSLKEDLLPQRISERIVSGESILSPQIKMGIFRIARQMQFEGIQTTRPSGDISKQIALVIPYHPLYELGGLEVGTLNLAHQLKALGQSPVIISKGIYEDRDLTGKIHLEDGVPVYGIGKGIEDVSHFLLQHQEDFSVVQWMEIFPPIPETKETYNDKAEQQYLTSVLLRALGIKTYLYVATSGNVTNRGVNNENWGSSAQRQPFNALLRSSMSGFNTINSQIPGEYERAGIQIPKDKIVTLPFGVDTDRFTPVDQERQMALREMYNLPKDKIIFFYLGRFVQRKRPDLLLNIWNSMPQEILDRAHLVFIGGAAAKGQPDSIYEEMQLRLAHATNVSAIDLVPQEKVHTAIQACDAMVFPSEREGLGVVLLEALSCGKTVFASNIDGVHELIAPLNPSMLFQPDALEEIREKMIDYVRSKNKHDSVSKDSRNYVISRYGWPAIAAQYLGFYKRT